MEYEVRLLDPAFKLHFGDNPVILSTNDLAEACTFCYNHYQATGEAICVHQPRTGYIREHYAPWLDADE